MQLKNAVAVVTGGANGIGAALCRRLAREGAGTVVVADVDEVGARHLAEEVDGLAVRCDVSREEDVMELVRRTEERCGPIDLYCSNAGIIIKGVLETSNDDW